MRIWKFLDVVKEIGGWEDYEQYQIEVGRMNEKKPDDDLNKSMISEINDM